MSRTWSALISATLLLVPAVGCDARNEVAIARDPATSPTIARLTPGDSGRRVPTPRDASPIARPRAHTADTAATPAARPRSATARAVASPTGSRTTLQSGPRRVMLGTLDLTGLGHDDGSATAPVVLIDFSDFGCPYCGQFTRETWPVIERDYVRTGKVFFKYVPFIVGMFPHAAEATRATECVADQGRFRQMADHVYEAQNSWRGGGDPRALLAGIAGVVGADTAEFSRCYTDRRTEPRTARANAVTAAIGVRVTPSFLVNERPIQGALPLADFRRVIDAALLLASAKR